MSLLSGVRRHESPSKILQTIHQRRTVSTKGAINKGLRATQRSERGDADRGKLNSSSNPFNARDRQQSRSRFSPVNKSNPFNTGQRRQPIPPRPINSRHPSRRPWEGRSTNAPRSFQGVIGDRARSLRSREDSQGGKQTGPRVESFAPIQKTLKKNDGGNSQRRLWSKEAKVITNDSIPVPTPVQYTTSASQFLYGHNTVFAALKSGRRKTYVLHMKSDGPMWLPRDLLKDITIEKHRHDSMLDRMSGGRPHNGVVLEASALPFPPVLALGKVQTSDEPISFVAGHQSQEDGAINGIQTTIPRHCGKGRFPLVLLLDGILDEGNLGAILRSAAFLGVDAVGIVTATCAPLSTVMAKASSGASEIVPLFAVPRASDFVRQCRLNGWTVWASVAASYKDRSKKRDVQSPHALRRQDLCGDGAHILMMGGESDGLNARLLEKATCFVTIPSARRDGHSLADYGVDSLNVSVATALLVEAFLRAKRPHNKSLTNINSSAEETEIKH